MLKMAQNKDFVCGGPVFDTRVVACMDSAIMCSKVAGWALIGAWAVNGMNTVIVVHII